MLKGGKNLTDFKSIYQLHFKDVYRFIYAMCRDEHVAEEITQETFLKALKHIDTYQGKCKLNVWLCQIAKNTFYSYHAKQSKTHEWTELGENTLAGGRGQEELILQKEEALRVHKILHVMKEPYKEVFTLRVFGELSFAEISQLFGKSESWARVTFYRAKQRIQEKLKEARS
ncbi:RNA polymerase sigma factor [Paenibacillus septentrionalis]|uniref:RNA polymerase sigma factor n=1 Tax=Paenibacillus septentrionalis TaxID=429342 RepID=A0ABW1VBQ6_9BACL